MIGKAGLGEKSISQKWISNAMVAYSLWHPYGNFNSPNGDLTVFMQAVQRPHIF